MLAAAPPTFLLLSSTHSNMADGNYAILEHLLPEHAFEWTTEDDVIGFLLENNNFRAALLQILETNPWSQPQRIFISHQRLLIPLSYNLGEGDVVFSSQLRNRWWAGNTSRTVRWLA